MLSSDLDTSPTAHMQAYAKRESCEGSRNDATTTHTWAGTTQLRHLVHWAALAAPLAVVVWGLPRLYPHGWVTPGCHPPIALPHVACGGGARRAVAHGAAWCGRSRESQRGCEYSRGREHGVRIGMVHLQERVKVRLRDW